MRKSIVKPVVGILVATMAVLGVAATKAEAQVPDLTGTYEGWQKCKNFDGAAYKTKCKGDLEITQTGTNLNMEGCSGTLFNGELIRHNGRPDKKGEVAFIACGTTPDLDRAGEMGRAKVERKVRSGRTTFKATSVWYSPTGLVGTCKWHYVRVDMTDPGVAACPP